MNGLVDRLPPKLTLRLRRLLRPLRIGALQGTRPVSAQWGFDRGTPIDRWYIERFLEIHRGDIHGRVLEVKDSGYTDLLGAGITRSDVVDIDAGNPRATIVADLATADAIPSDTFDCFVFTQTLQFIGEPRAAMQHIHRVLRPGGICLATLPALSRVERAYAGSDLWRFTPASAQLLFGEVFGGEAVTVQPFGNVLVAMAYLTGLAAEELSARELETAEEHFPVLIGVRAVKGTGTANP